MKHNYYFNLVLVSLFICAQALSALPPTTIKGQDDSTASTTFGLQVPGYQSTRLSGTSALIETGNYNLLQDPSFEAATLGNRWSVVGAGFSVAADASNYFHGKKSLTLTYSASTGYILQSWTLPTGLAGQNLEYSMRVKTALTTLKLCVLNGGVQMQCSDIPSTNTWNLVTVNYPAPASGVQAIAIIASSSTTGTANIDDAYIGLPRNLGTVSQAQFYGSIKYAQSTNCIWTNTGNATLTWQSFAADTDCATPTVTGNASAPATKVPAIVFASLPAGRYVFHVKGHMYSAPASQTNAIFRMYDGSSGLEGMQEVGTGYSGAGENEAMTGQFVAEKTYTTAQSNITFTLQSANHVGVSAVQTVNDSPSWAEFSISVYRFPTQDETVYKTNQTPWHVDANISGANPSLGTASQSAYVGIEDAGLTLTQNTGSIGAQIPCSSTNAPSGTTCAAGNESVGVSFNLPVAGDVLACASLGVEIGLGASGALFGAMQIVETPTNAQTISQEGKSRVTFGNRVASSTVDQGLRVCGTFSFASAGQKVLRLMYEQSATATVSSVIALADALSSAGQRDIHWEVYPITPYMPAPSIIGSVTSNSSGLERIERARITNNGTAAIASQSGSWLSSVTRNSTGIVTLNFASGIFSSAPSCTCSPEWSGRICVQTTTVATTSAIQFTTMPANTVTEADMNFNVICMGPR